MSKLESKFNFTFGCQMLPLRETSYSVYGMPLYCLLQPLVNLYLSQ